MDGQIPCGLFCKHRHYSTHKADLHVHVHVHVQYTLASGARPGRGKPGSKLGLKAGVSLATGHGFGQAGQGIRNLGKPQPRGKPGLAKTFQVGQGKSKISPGHTLHQEPGQKPGKHGKA